MPITRTAWIDDDGSGTTGTILNNAEKTILYDQIDAALLDASSQNTETVRTSTDVGTVNNWAPGLVGHTLVVWSGATPLTVNTMAGGSIGQRVTISNGGSSVAYFAHASGAVPAVFFLNPATSAPTPIAQNGSVTYQHDGYAWRQIAHDQGDWITPPYSAANFTSASGSWIVEAADVAINRYRLSAKTLSVWCEVHGSSVTGSPATLSWKIPGGFSAMFAGSAVRHGVYPGGKPRFVQLSGTSIVIYEDHTTTTLWPATTNATQVIFDLTFPVT